MRSVERRAGTLAAGLFLAASIAGAAPPVKATGSVELPDAAGDMGPMHMSSGDVPALDVVKLSIKSDGSRLTIGATLKDPPGSFASSVVEVYLDTDNNEQTGVELRSAQNRGFEYVAKIEACADYTDGASACVGGSSKAKPKAHWAAVDLQRLKGNAYSGDTVVDSMGFPGSKASAKTPITGTLVESSIDYADLKVKPGQTIRLLAYESGGSPKDEGYFPLVVLTLK